jgi:hypothetical protein
MIPGFLAPQGPKIFFAETLAFTFPRCCLAYSGNVYRGDPLVGVTKKILAAGTKVRQTSTVAPWGVLSGFSVAATTEAGDVDGGPPGEVLSAGLATTTTEAGDIDGRPLGVAVRIFGSGHHRC